MEHSRVWATVAGCLVLVAAGTIVLWDRQEKASEHSSGGTPVGGRHASGALEGGQSLQRPYQRRAIEPEPAVADPHENDTASVSEAIVLREAAVSLKSSIEASLFGVLDPTEIIDAALLLGRLDVDERPRSQADVSGCLVYPLLEPPEGVQASLLVGHSRKAGVAEVLSLRIEIAPRELPYLLEGCARTGAGAQIQMQLDAHGQPLNLSILTDLPPSSRNLDLGLPLGSGRITNGVLYHVDADQPADWGVRVHGLNDGSPASWEGESLVVAGHGLLSQKLQAFSDMLADKYASVKH